MKISDLNKLRETYSAARAVVANMETALEARKGELAGLEAAADPGDDAALDTIGRHYTALRLIPARIEAAQQTVEIAKRAFIDATNQFIAGPLREKFTTVREAARKKVHATLAPLISDPLALDVAISQTRVFGDIEVLDRTTGVQENPFDSFVHCQTALDTFKRLVEIEKSL